MKRGIAPLVATLLLISFAVALGVVVMTFGRAQVELEAQCPININMRFLEVGGKDDICYHDTNKELRFTVENGVNIKVFGLLVNIVGEEDVMSVPLDANIDKAGNYRAKISYDATTTGALRQVKVIPKIILQDNEQICTKKALLVETIPPC